MRIIFMGTPDFAVPALDALVAAGHDIAAVYSQPPRRAGRGKKLTPSPVQARADSLGLTVRTPVSLKDAEVQADFAALGTDIAVVAAYGLLLPQAILDAPRLGCLNIHASLLPRWRGAAPVQRAILAGDTETGVSIMQMAAGLDTGSVRAVEIVEMRDKTAGELTEELAAEGADLLIHVLDHFEHCPAEPQPETGVTYAKKIDKAEARLDFTQDAEAVLRQVRAFNPAPGAFFEYEGERYRVHVAHVAEGAGAPGETIDERLTIACGTGAIRPTIIQRAGKPPMGTDDLLRGRAFPKGVRL